MDGYLGECVDTARKLRWEYGQAQVMRGGLTSEEKTLPEGKF